MAFFEDLLNDKSFRRQLIEDRSYMFRYFMAHRELDRSAVQRMQEDLAFSRSLLNDPGPINTWLTEYKRRLAEFPKSTPVDRIRPVYEEAVEDGKQTLAFRAQMLLDRQGEPVEENPIFTASDFNVASPATLVWMGERMRTINVEIAKNALNTLLETFPNSEQVGDALMLLGQIAADGFQYEEAIEHFQALQERMPASRMAARATVRIADIYIEQEQFDRAREIYSRIMKNPRWRGEPQAEALYKLGMLNYDRGEYGKARAFFERVYVGHAYYTEWAAKSYVMDARSLIAQGNRSDAASVINEAREVAGLNDT